MSRLIDSICGNLICSSHRHHSLCHHSQLVCYVCFLTTAIGRHPCWVIHKLLNNTGGQKGYLSFTVGRRFGEHILGNAATLMFLEGYRPGVCLCLAWYVVTSSPSFSLSVSLSHCSMPLSLLSSSQCVPLALSFSHVLSFSLLSISFCLPLSQLSAQSCRPGPWPRPAPAWLCVSLWNGERAAELRNRPLIKDMGLHTQTDTPESHMHLCVHTQTNTLAHSVTGLRLLSQMYPYIILSSSLLSISCSCFSPVGLSFTLTCTHTCAHTQ